MPSRSPTDAPDFRSGAPCAVFCDTDAPPHIERSRNLASRVTVYISGHNVSLPDVPLATERFYVSPEFNPSHGRLPSEFGEFFSIYERVTSSEGRIHLGAFWNLLDRLVDDNLLSQEEAPDYWYEALRSSRHNIPCKPLLDLIYERRIAFSVEQNDADEEVPEAIRDLMSNSSRIFGSDGGSVSNGPFQDTESKVMTRPEITDEIIDIFKEEGLNAEETRRALTEMLNSGEITVKSLRVDGPLFIYGDDRRYIANRVLNKVFEFRRKEREMKKRRSDANRGSFDPSVDMMTGRPVGCL